MAYERDPNEIGALWLRTGGRGDYLTGKIGDVDVICFPVSSQNPKAPTWRVLKSQPREDRQERHEQQERPQQAPRQPQTRKPAPWASAKRQAEPVSAPNDDDIPFTVFVPLVLPFLGLLG